MTNGRRIGSAITIAALVAGATASSAPAKGTKLQGTISWTTTATTKTDTPGGDAFTAKETRTVTLKVKMTKRAGAAGWQPEDNGSSYTGRYTLSSTRLERDSTGAITCTTTNESTGSGSGALPKKPRSTTPPALFGDVLPSTASLGARTKAIVLQPLLRYKGQATVKYEGSGLSPCQSGQDVDPIDGSLAPTDSSEQICYPSGTSKRTTTPRAGTVMGAWKKSARAFSFTCSDTWKEPEGKTVTTRVTGSLKLK
ncbi:MAG: hypothetical protein ACEQSX_10975 [Baekduiaceae bacterium]